MGGRGSHSSSYTTPSFDSTTSFTERQNFFETNFNIHVDDSVNTLTQTAQHEALKGIVDSLQKYPELASSVNTVRVATRKDDTFHMYTRAIASFDQEKGTMNLWKKYFKDPKKIQDKQALVHKMGLQQASDIRSITIHEMGHALEQHIALKTGERSVAASAVIKGLKGIHAKDRSSLEKISKYASKHDKEAFAEAFTDVTLHGAKANKLSKSIMKSVGY